MPDRRAYQTLEFTPTFFATFITMAPVEQARLVRTLHLLDTDERTPSLRLHKLQGKKSGQWSASASTSLRIVFERLESGRKVLLECSQHYGD